MVSFFIERREKIEKKNINVYVWVRGLIERWNIFVYDFCFICDVGDRVIC